MQLDGCLFYFSSRKDLFQPAIYIEIIFNLYINEKRFIYKLKTIYIFIEIVLYTNRSPTS
ncbi:hypothetical protein CS546_09280 [Porphyromonas gingivalis]|nr:hypothetical protein CS546_09280 [Porphyromonas gingivalis]ATR96454.1 hypothetical protein CS548_04760 [Porphyromonas gingivalis]PDP49271.1 hypothetical protein CLI77_05920 [Porphyromonas gingivalis]